MQFGNWNTQWLHLWCIALIPAIKDTPIYMYMAEAVLLSDQPVP